MGTVKKLTVEGLRGIVKSEVKRLTEMRGRHPGEPLEGDLGPEEGQELAAIEPALAAAAAAADDFYMKLTLLHSVMDHSSDEILNGEKGKVEEMFLQVMEMQEYLDNIGV